MWRLRLAINRLFSSRCIIGTFYSLKIANVCDVKLVKKLRVCEKESFTIYTTTACGHNERQKNVEMCGFMFRALFEFKSNTVQRVALVTRLRCGASITLIELDAAAKSYIAMRFNLFFYRDPMRDTILAISIFQCRALQVGCENNVVPANWPDPTLHHHFKFHKVCQSNKLISIFT